MRDYSTKADARIVIDDLLRQARWDPADKSQVLTEQTTPTGGRTDYLLLAKNGRPLAIVEAKRSAIEPYTAKSTPSPRASAACLCFTKPAPAKTRR